MADRDMTAVVDRGELARIFDVSERTIKRWMASDNPPPTLRPSGTQGPLRFLVGDVVEWARKGGTDAPAPVGE